jgi:mannose/fructose/N-acetylgalactosamine-specific phosphotransferase system component IIC
VRNPASAILLVLFALSVFGTYLTIRRTQRPVFTIAIVGGVIDCALFMLYSLSVGNPFVQAAVIGIVLGVLFDGLIVTAATFFRQNEAPDRRPPL